VHKTSKGRGGIYEGRESYRVASIVAEVKIEGCLGYIVNWEGLSKEVNTTEDVVNVKRQGDWEFVLEHLKAAKIEGNKVSARKLIMLSHFRSFRRFGVFAPF
jgi:predicted alpha/beta-fold hydrolase